MDKDKQRIKIAEACGWDLNHDSQKWDYFQPNGKGWNGPLPDYLNDLHANPDAWQYYFLKFNECEEGWGTGKIKPEFQHLFDEKGNLI